MTKEELDKLSPSVVSDVREFLRDNVRLGLDMDSMSKTEFFKCWLEWNGIQGWTDPIISTIEKLGWMPPETSTNMRDALLDLMQLVVIWMENLEKNGGIEWVEPPPAVTKAARVLGIPAPFLRPNVAGAGTQSGS